VRVCNKMIDVNVFALWSVEAFNDVVRPRPLDSLRFPLVLNGIQIAPFISEALYGSGTAGSGPN
jgi:hypothetical protein